MNVEWIVRQDKLEVEKLGAPKPSKTSDEHVEISATVRLRYELDDATVNRATEVIPGAIEAIRAAILADENEESFQAVYLVKPGVKVAVALEGRLDDNVERIKGAPRLYAMTVVEQVKLTASTAGFLVDTTLKFELQPAEVETLTRILLERGAKLEHMQQGLPFGESRGVTLEDIDIAPAPPEEKRSAPPSLSRRPVSKALEDLEEGLYDDRLDEEHERELKGKNRAQVLSAIKDRRDTVQLFAQG